MLNKSKKKSFNNIMVDLETLGVDPDAAFVSIGACAFDINSSEIAANKFHMKIDWSDVLEHRKVSASTIKWWMTQSEKARQNIIDESESVNLNKALEEFRKWLYSFAKHQENEIDDLFIWSKGTDFDISILKTAYTNPPWNFRNVRDARTLLNIFNWNDFDENEKNILKSKNTHSAVEDAVNQAKQVSMVFNKLRKNFQN